MLSLSHAISDCANGYVIVCDAITFHDYKKMKTIEFGIASGRLSPQTKDSGSVKPSVFIYVWFRKSGFEIPNKVDKILLNLDSYCSCDRDRPNSVPTVYIKLPLARSPAQWKDFRVLGIAQILQDILPPVKRIVRNVSHSAFISLRCIIAWAREMRTCA